MTLDDVLDDVKKRLLARKGELKKSLAGPSYVELPEKNIFVHDGESHNYNPDTRTVISACRKVLAAELAQVEKALKILNVNPEKYGMCEYCGKKIIKERMDVQMEATACVACLEKHKNKVVF